MDIQNFTNDNIRLGEYPQCIDISCPRYKDSDSKYHSSYGVIATAYPSDLDQYKCFTVIVRCIGTGAIRMITCKWEEQLEAFLNDKLLFPHEHGFEYIFDSRSF